MGKLQEDIENLVTMNISKPKLGIRLIEAGIAAHRTIDDNDWLKVIDAETGEFSIEGYQPPPPPRKLGSNDKIIFRMDGGMTAEILVEQIVEVVERQPGLVGILAGLSKLNIAEMTAALEWGGELLDTYARNHLEKEPPQLEKAQRNIEAATKLYAAAGVAYAPPFLTSTEMAGVEDWKSSIQADSSPVQPDSDLQASGSARALLTALQAAESDDKPTLGITVHLEDQPILATLVELGFVTRDDVSDKVLLSTKGREAIGLRPKGLPDLPVEVASVTGNIAEAELAAQYLDGKIAGCERHIREGTLPENVENLRYVAAVLTECAHEFRINMHIPAQVIEGKIIPYNDYRGDGVLYQDSLRAFYQAVHGSNVKAGWWTDLETGEPKLRNLGELLMLFVTEIWEAFSAYENNDNDDKLPQHPGLGVELGDLEIRLADLCGALLAGRVARWSNTRNPGEELFREVGKIAERYEAIRKTPEAVGERENGHPMEPMDVAAMVDDKLAFNATRADHKIENRLKDDGKKT